MDQNKIRVLVTGAAGNIGQELIKMLTRRHNQFEVSVFDLNSPKNREFFDRYFDKINIFYGDVTDPTSLRDAIQNQDIIIHLASIIPPLAFREPELTKHVNIGGTANLVTSIEEYSPNAFLIIASSVAVYGDRLTNPYINIGDPLNPVAGDNYAASKIEMEKIVQASSLNWTIFRLSAVMGVGNHVSPELMFRVPLEQIMEICTPRDVARALTNSIYKVEELRGKVFNLGGGAVCTTTFGELLKKNFEIYGLGALDFPKNAFATKNFHCGYYEDGDELNNILDFRRDTLDDYYKQLKAKTPKLQRLATMGVSKLVKSYLLSKSEPYEAWINNDEEKKKLYFR